LKKVDALVFAAAPPPIGGVASIVAMLHQGFANRNDIAFLSPAAREPRPLAGFVRPLKNIIRLTRAVSQVREGGRVLLFSSAGGSFFEKILWSLLVVSRARIAVVVMVAGNFPSFWNKLPLMFRRIASRIIRSPLFELTAQSEAWRNYYRSIFPLATIKKVGATVAAEFFERPISAARGEEILYVGWIIPEKGILDLLDAMAILSETHPGANLRLVGPLFGKEEFWNKSALERGIASQVKFIGAISDRTGLIREFDNAAVFVFPSHFEGFPVALLEAIARGLACVGTTVGGIPDILEHGQAGVLVEPKAPLELAEAFRSLIEDPGRRETFSKRAAVRARTAYSHAECMGSYKRLLELK